MELNREQIIKQMQEWCDNMCENACLKGESFNGRIRTCEICFPNTVKNALALIKELTEENKAWQEQLISQEEKSGKAYYDLACEVEDLRAKNERLRAENEVLETNVKDLRGRNNGLQRANESLAKDCDILEGELNECVQIKADTVRKMQERLKAQKFTHKNFGELVYVDDIDQIAKEVLEGL